MKTADLEGAQLDYWVAKAEGMDMVLRETEGGLQPAFEIDYEPAGQFSEVSEDNSKMWLYFMPSRRWEHGGPFIEHYEMRSSCIVPQGETVKRWLYWTPATPLMSGKTPLEAAMRCRVYEEFGDTVPDQ